jgi:hypothetical protein
MRNHTLSSLPMGLALMEAFSRRLHDQQFLFLTGTHFAEVLGLGQQEVSDFGDHWKRLTKDHCMADGGSYRYRRYGEFNAPLKQGRHQLPHRPYEQPSYINKLNGGIPRLFDPLEPSFVRHPVLVRLLDWLTCLYDWCEGQAQHWNIRLHPYRIVASQHASGHPTPEGLHRDGVDYIVSMMISRNNIEGGVSTITDPCGTVLWQRTLQTPLDIMIGNDVSTLHAVTPIVPSNPGLPAWRDVLVVAFTKVLP